MPGQAVRKSRCAKSSIRSPANLPARMCCWWTIPSRGTTSHEMQMARDAMPRKCTLPSAALAVRFPNVPGIDMPTRAELLATNRDDADYR